MGSNCTFTALVAECLLYRNTLSTMGTKGEGGGEEVGMFFRQEIKFGNNPSRVC